MPFFFSKLKKILEGGGFAKLPHPDAEKVASRASKDTRDSTDALSCCSGRVHIAYRGVSDDRLYLAENRHKNEVKFFRPLGLRIFCADCRKRLS